MTLLNRIALLLLTSVAGWSPAGEIGAENRLENGFKFPGRNPAYEFPRDHGSHPDYRIEWWYITGHLRTKERRFGFQATFFRFAERPGPAPDGAFSDGQFYLAHMALSEPAADRFIHEERLNRAGWDASAKTGDLDLRNGNWTLTRSDNERFQLTGSIFSDARFALELAPGKPKVIFGENGVSRKGAEPGNASHYITFSRLEVSGSLRIDGQDLEIAGQAWMDHEISSSQLAADQAGWDWLSVQLDDGREIMAYLLRKEDGTPSVFSSLNWIDRSGEITSLASGEFSWEAEGTWKSRKTGAEYPIRLRIEANDPETGRLRIFLVRPTMDRQEMTGELGGVVYWEGACDIQDEGGEKIGVGFLELTGYADDELEERLK